MICNLLPKQLAAINYNPSYVYRKTLVYLKLPSRELPHRFCSSSSVSTSAAHNSSTSCFMRFCLDTNAATSYNVCRAYFLEHQRSGLSVSLAGRQAALLRWSRPPLESHCQCHAHWPGCLDWHHKIAGKPECLCLLSSSSML